MMRNTLVLASLTFHAGLAQAHVSAAPAAQHMIEHAWLALMLLPAGFIGLRLLRRRR